MLDYEIIDRVLENETRNGPIYFEENKLVGYRDGKSQLMKLEDEVDLSITQKVIEFACGRGHFAHLLAKKYPKINVLGLDVDRESIRFAQNNSTVSNLHYIVKDGTDTGLEDEYYDLSICYNSLHHFKNPQSLVAEMIRVTKKGGILSIIDFLRDIHPTFLRLIETSENIGQYRHDLLSASIKSSLTIEEYKQIAQMYALSEKDIKLFDAKGECGILIPFINWTTTLI